MSREFIKYNDRLCRILKENGERSLIIDCMATRLPVWINNDAFDDLPETEIIASDVIKGILSIEEAELNPAQTAVINKRFTMIADILPVIENKAERAEQIKAAAKRFGVSIVTIRTYLCRYLVSQSRNGLVIFYDGIKEKEDKQSEHRELTKDQKNMRWALNKYYYNTKKNSLNHAYINLLKEKYLTEDGALLEEHPSFYQFRYFYRKTRNCQNEIISRYGLNYFKKNERLCVGDGVRAFATGIGKGMLDSTICDLYLVNEAGEVIGRPVLTACVDAYSGLCMGYSLGWEGGVYSLRTLMLCILADKKEWCKKRGIMLDNSDWSCNLMPAELITDKGSEYKSENFEQLTELGITITNLPPFRPELKGPVEKFFDVVQNYFKPYLKGKGVIQPDFMERGAVDYRKQASLTIEQFEAILIECIIFYNAKRIIEDFPYTEEMLQQKIKPYSQDIWKFGLTKEEANVLSVSAKKVIMTLLPRTKAKFTRFGLAVNGLHYRNDDYKKEMLNGGTGVAAYLPEDSNEVFLIENGRYVAFTLIEQRFNNKSLDEVQDIKEQQKSLVMECRKDEIKSKIDLAVKIENLLGIAKKQMGSSNTDNPSLKSIRQNRKKEQERNHFDVLKEAKHV